MLSPADFIILPYDDQFSRAGVQYARDSLHFTYNRMNLNPGDRLRKIVAGVAFEMATRRWLEGAGIQYNRLGATAFTSPDRFDLALGGRRVDLKSSLLYDKAKILALRADPSWALEAAALIPDDQFQSERMGENDLYVFGFVTGLEARHSADTDKVARQRLPVYLIHVLPPAVWATPDGWRPLGPITLHNAAAHPIRLEAGGQAADHSAIRERNLLEAEAQLTLTNNYYSLLYLAAPRQPVGALTVRSPLSNRPYLIQPMQWDNIWVYGQRVYLCGWLNKHDFRERSRYLPPGSPVKQYRRTATANRAVPIGELRPLAELADLARKHAGV